jgi:hypothetical protein
VALLDLPREQDAQAMGGASTTERVRTALVERDDALRRAHEDLAGARSVAASGRGRHCPRPAPTGPRGP